MLPPDPKLYGILDLGYVTIENAESVTRDLLAGGVDLLQLRAKASELPAIRDLAGKLIPLCRAAKVPFILNDFPELAAELDADGVHIGQDDGDMEAVRSIVGSGKIVGRSTHSLAQAKGALAEGADYIGFGPLFPTPTKPGRPSIGLKDIQQMEAEVGCKLPAFCIGGINRDTLPQVIEAGARRIVVVSDLLKADDVPAAAQFFKKSLPRN